MLENGHGDVTNLICLNALRDAIREAEKAQRRYRQATYALARVRAKLDRAVEQAHEQQSFAPLENLFDEGEAAPTVYEQAKTQLTSAEERGPH